ncbi:MAG: glycosyltransferase [Opitutaceae bacterium]|nr:glycosyltransferase [Opitutaceae bacterium]
MNPTARGLTARAAIFLPSLGGGGAEMHALRIANEAHWGELRPEFVLSRQGGRYEPRIKADLPITHLLPRWVRSSRLSMALSVLPLRLWLKREKPDVLISFLNHTTVVAHLAMSGLKRRPKFVVGLQNNLSAEGKEWIGPSGAWFVKRLRTAHQEANAIVALSKGVALDYRTFAPSNEAKVSVIHNAGYDDGVLTLGEAPVELSKPRNLIVACGRLTEQKDYPLMLRSFALVRRTWESELWILGEGHLRGSLLALAKDLGVADSVRFLGFDPNPYRYMAMADVFLLTSAWEGFGNVLVEAMALGTPVVAANCPHGPAEIIEDGVSGRLVDGREPDSFARVLAECLSSPALRLRLAEGGRMRSATFSARNVGSDYVRLVKLLV